MRVFIAAVLLRVELLPDSASWKIENEEESASFNSNRVVVCGTSPCFCGFQGRNEDEHDILVRSSVAVCRASVWFCNFVDRQ